MLIEVAPLLNGVTKTVWMSSAGNYDASGTLLNNLQWLPVITQQPTRDISLSSDGVLDTITVSYGAVNFWMAPDFSNEVWSSYEWVGALARIYVGNAGDPFTAYTQIFEGSVSSLERDGITATMQLLGPDASLDRNILSLTYGGTGGADGPPSLAGKLKPMAFGQCLTVEPVLVDQAHWIYQVHGYGAVSALNVYDFAIALDPAKRKADQASYSDLAALTLIPGEWATCLAQGLFRLGATPTTKISADVTVGGSTVATIVPAILAVAGVPAAKVGDFSAFSSAGWCLYQTEQATVGDLARAVLQQAGGYLIADGTGKWRCGDYFAPQAAVTLTPDSTSMPLVQSYKELPSAAPIYKASIGYSRCWNVHSDSDVSPALRDLSDANAANAAALKALQDNAAQTASDAQAAKARLDSIEADGVLDRSEKAEVIAEFSTETAQQTGLQNQTTNVDVTSEKANLASAYAALKAYLEGLSPAYTDSTQNTTIDRATFNTKWGNYWLAKQTLVNKLAGLGSTTANWGGVTGTGKPADNADVTSQNTAKDTAAVGGVAASTVVGAIKDSSGNVVGVQALKDATAAAASTAATARTEAAQVRTDLTPSVSQAQSDATAAKTDAAKARTDLASEVSRAQGAEGTLTTNLASVKQTADKATTSISDEILARTTADSSLANRTTTLESGFTKLNDNPNLLGPINEWTGAVTYFANQVWGPIIAWSGTLPDHEEVFATSPRVTLQASTTYTLSCDLQGAGGATVYSNMDVVCYDASGNMLLDGPNTNSITNQDFSDSRGIGAVAITFTTPANTSYGIVRLVGNARNVTLAYIGARKVKLERGSAATIYNDAMALPIVNASLKTEATTRATADTAISNRTTTLESTVNNATTGLAATTARIATEETTRSNADTALANRAYTLESRAGNSSNYANPNANFTAWPDGGAIPAQWSFWSNRGTFTRENSQFTNGNYLLGHAVTDGNDAGLATTVYLTPGYWVMEGQAWCSSGTFAGAGMYVDNLALLNFSTVPDSNNTTGAGGLGVRNWSFMIQTAFTGNAVLYLMTNWSSFGTTSAKTLHWLKCGIRPATDGEIKAQKADATLNNPGGIVARMGTEETTRASADTALANRATSLESTVNTPTTGLSARMSTEETTRANADTALSNRATNLESTVNNGTSGVAATYARIGAEETTRANAVSAVANRTSTLETRAGNSTNFTNANPTFAAWQDGAAFPAQWSTWQGGTVSREAVNFTSGGYAAYQNVPNADQGFCTQFYVTAGYWVYEASVWCSTGTFQGAGLYADNLPGLNFSTVPDINNVTGVGSTGIRNWSYLVQTTYTGQINLYAMGNWASFGTTSGKVLHWLKAGIRPASSAEVLALKADATLNNAGGIVARMGTEETTRANADSALANRASTLESNFTKLLPAPNLLGPLNDWTGPGSFITNGYWGPTFQWGGQSGDFEQLFAQSPRVYLPGNATFTLSCDLLAAGGATVYASMDVIGYDANNNLVLDSPNTNSLTNADFSDARGIGAIAVTFNTPSNLAYAYVRLLGNARNVARADIGCRKVKLERSPSATAYSNDMAVTIVNSSIKDEATTRSSNDGALSNRIGTLEASIYTGGTGLAARMSTEENARANADGALASRTGTLEASVSTGGNLLTSSNFNSGSAGWGAAYTNASFSAGINIAGDDWHPANENALSFTQNNNDGGQYGYWYSDLIPVNQGQWYQVSCYVASHRADSGIGYEFWNYNGQTLLASTQPVRISRGSNANGGKDLNSWDRVYFNVQAAGPLMKAQLWKWGTNGGNNDSYAWFVRPQICAVANGNAPYNPYSPASGSAQLGNTTARVATSEAAISNLNGRAAAYWQVQTVAGNNRAQLTVRADANGGAGVDIVGDVNFSGNLNIGADSGGNRTKITNQNYQVFDGNGVRRVALGLGF
ncbi:hypothetical protein [Sphingomonas sp. BAUL-RG-20F-R05-02]|uniref:hypothetical protein n=1 Tax=Sphingomonas sp. BAUL-RG-20F-R05-02 TaxID=2914830 RepID=UPI001F5AE95F|nr:hypothetical protein [Sphingomonas sp. BAUL-RG-20F-R05-02]